MSSELWRSHLEQQLVKANEKIKVMQEALMRIAFDVNVSDSEIAQEALRKVGVIK